ncbi:hypothetical protein BGZ58_010594, partial [Dissophora ornata]
MSHAFSYTRSEPKGRTTTGKPFLTPIFNERSTLGTHKIVSFKRITDFGFDRQYSELSGAHTGVLMSKEIEAILNKGVGQVIVATGYKSTNMNPVRPLFVVRDGNFGTLEEGGAKSCIRYVETLGLKKCLSQHGTGNAPPSDISEMAKEIGSSSPRQSGGAS